MNLRDQLQQLVKTDESIYSIPGTVTSVDKSANTCEVEPLDDSATLVEVRLQAGAGAGWVVYPVAGSVVLVSFLNRDDAFVSMVSEVDVFDIQTQTESMKALLSDFIDQVSNLKVTTNSGASIEVINKPQLLQIKNRLNNLFK